MPHLYQFLLTAALVAVLDTSLKTNPAIIQRDRIWTRIVFAGMRIWNYFAQRHNENQAPKTL